MSSREIYNKGVFLLSPVLSVVIALRNWRSASSTNIFWAFCVFYGFCLVIYSQGHDAAMYAQWFREMYNGETSLKDFSKHLYSESGEATYLDIAQPGISFLLSRVTDDTRWLFALFAFFFGFFLSRNLWIVFRLWNGNSRPLSMMFVLGFFLLNPIWNINGFRFWTATHIFFWSSVNYLLSNERKFLLLSLLPIVFHFSFVIPVISFLSFVGFTRNLSAYFVVFIVTSILSYIDLGILFQSLGDLLPAILEVKKESYFNENVISSRLEDANATNWYIRYNTLFIKITVQLGLSLVFYWRRVRKATLPDSFDNVLCFTLFMYSIANLLSTFPEGFRFYTIANMGAYALFVWSFSFNSVIVLFKKFSFIFIPLILITMIVAVRRGLELTGLSVLISNPIFAYFIEDEIPLLNLIK